MTKKAPDKTRYEQEIGNLGRAEKARRETSLELSMSERLARLHALCKQMSAVKGAASPR